MKNPIKVIGISERWILTQNGCDRNCRSAGRARHPEKAAETQANGNKTALKSPKPAPKNAGFGLYCESTAGRARQRYGQRERMNGVQRPCLWRRGLGTAAESPTKKS